jgi:Resolvase, N terminal domain
MNKFRPPSRSLFICERSSLRYLWKACRRFGSARPRASEAAADRITEQVSSVAPRKALEEAIDYARECDARLQAKSIDTGAPTGKLMLNLLGSIAEFERGVMLERQCEGIAIDRPRSRHRDR